MDADALKSLPLFASLSRKERKEVARHADEVDVPEGKHLVEKGDFAYEFFVIEDGTAEVLNGDEHVAELGPGDFFGETALVERVTRNASVVATTPMRLVVMTAQEFRGMERELPEVCDRIRVAIDERGRTLPA